MPPKMLCKKNTVFFFCLILLSQSSAFAVPSQCWDPRKVKERQEKTKERTKDYRAMKDPVEFPDLPTFNGHTKFISGSMDSNNNGVTTCQMQFSAQEEPQSVIAFYKSALATNQWKLLFANSHTISAQHGKGHICNINVNECSIPKIKCQYTVNYRQIEKQ